MGELKTKPTNKRPTDFLNTVKPEQKRLDSFEILKMMQDVTGELPRMWGEAIIGFGMYQGDWPLIGFSPRKQNLTLYLMQGIQKFEDTLSKLGKHKTTKGCLYINKFT